MRPIPARQESISVVAGVDGCRLSLRAFEVAAAVRRGSGSVHCVHATEPTWETKPAHVRPAFLHSEFTSQAKLNDVPVDRFAFDVIDKQLYHELIGWPREASFGVKDVIVHYGRAMQAHYVVLGSFGLKGPSVFALGSAASWSVRRSTVSTIIVKPDIRLSRGSRTFVACINTSPTSHLALHHAVNVARDEDRVIVLHVRQDWRGKDRCYEQAQLHEEVATALRSSGFVSTGGLPLARTCTHARTRSPCPASPCTSRPPTAAAPSRAKCATSPTSTTPA